MSDITKCLNAECPKRFSCYRWTAPHHDYWQAICMFEPDENGKCEYYWEDNHE